MSVESIAIALNHSRATGTARLVLIGMANHDADGGIWPSIERLRRYAGGVHARNVQRAVDRLIQLGEVEKLVQQGGTRDTREEVRPNLYRFLLTCPPDCDRTAQHNTRRGRRVRLMDDGPDETLWTTPELSTGVALAPPGPLAPAPPEPYLETTTKEGRPVSVRARPPLCLDGTRFHAVSRRAGRCVYCGARADLIPTGRQHA